MQIESRKKTKENKHLFKKISEKTFLSFFFKFQTLMLHLYKYIFLNSINYLIELHLKKDYALSI